MRIVVGIILMLSIASCSKMERKLKDTQSEWVGLNRRIEVYGCASNKPIKVYEGKTDVSFKDNRILFELNGKRHAISGGVVIIEEK